MNEKHTLADRWRALPRAFVWATTLVGTLVVGAMGNGVWELALSPALNWLMRASMSLTNAMYGGFRNVVYKTVAQPDTTWFAAIAACAFGFFFGFILSGAVGFLVARRVFKGDPTSGPRFRRAAMFSPVVTVGVWVWLVVLLALLVPTATQLVYSRSAAGFFKQMLTIDAPYLSPAQVLTFESDFAQIQTKEDYVRLIDSLREIGRTHDLRMPSFSIW